MRYKCVKSLEVEQFDDNGFATGVHKIIRKGSVWEMDDSDYRIVGGKDTVRLENIRTNYWLEIPQKTLNENFEEVKKNEID